MYCTASSRQQPLAEPGRGSAGSLLSLKSPVLTGHPGPRLAGKRWQQSHDPGRKIHAANPLKSGMLEHMVLACNEAEDSDGIPASMQGMLLHR